MKGNVIGFDPNTNTGAISGHDGQRYDFVTMAWHGKRRPERGDVVDFTPSGQHATEIYVLEPAYVRPSFGQFYFSARGRISRSQYWLKFFLPVFVIGVVLAAISAASDGSLRSLPLLFQLVMLWPSLAILIKRIHDRDKTGALVWFIYGPMIVAIIFAVAAAIAGNDPDSAIAPALWMITTLLAIVVAGVGIWFFIEFGCMRGTIGANKYGPDPVPDR